MRFLILVVALTLSGCWTGNGLYSDGDARPALSPGTYEITYDGETHRERISVLSSGLTQVVDSDSKTLFGFAQLDREDRRFIAWERNRDAAAGDNSQTYWLVERRTHGEFVWYLPKCAGDDAEIARRVGATVHKGTVDECRFSTRASLETAMRKVEISGDVMRLIRVSSQ